MVAAPPQVPTTPATWGWMLQLYALRSAGSWGIGDLGDLREFVRWSATQHGAGRGPAQSAARARPDASGQPSPYTPSSRRFANPLALRIEELDVYRRADPDTRAEVAALRVSASTRGSTTTWCGRPSVRRWSCSGAPRADRSVLDESRRRSRGCGTGRPTARWPSGTAADGAGGPRRCVTSPDRRWRPRAGSWHRGSHSTPGCSNSVPSSWRPCGMPRADAGMALGILHDLAVGVDPEGADAWALADVLATGVSVGAPPDNFTPRGQDWGLPPWRPDRLAATGYAALRDMVRAVLVHADGLRIDHVAGLWRLWWIPPGEAPDRGTYVLLRRRRHACGSGPGGTSGRRPPWSARTSVRSNRR